MTLSSTELTDLKKRCYEVIATGASIAHHGEYMLALIEEVEASRAGAAKPGNALVRTKPAAKAEEKAPEVKPEEPKAPEPKVEEPKAPEVKPEEKKEEPAAEVTTETPASTEPETESSSKDEGAAAKDETSSDSSSSKAKGGKQKGGKGA